MNIMENKRVTAVAALMALAFVGVCYKGYEKFSLAKAAEQELAARESKLNAYANEKNAPTQETAQAMEKAAAKVKECADSLYKDLSKYMTVSSNIREQKLSAIGFQNRLRQLSADIVKQGGSNCRIANAADKMGLSHILDKLPSESEVPYLNFYASAVNHLEELIIASGAPSIDNVYFAGLPEQIPASATYIPLSFEIDFTARRSDVVKAGDVSSYSVLPQVINRVIRDDKYFYIITGMAVDAQNVLPMLKSTPDSSADASFADTESEAEPTGNSEQSKAKLEIGLPSETVAVHLNVRVIYFASDKI